MTTRYYTYDDIADRIAEVFGERPTPAILYGGERDPDRPVRGEIRVTAGMPTPLPGRPPRQFDADEVDAWLRKHPRLVARKRVEQLREAITGTLVRQDAVAAARNAGLSWQQITDVIQEVDEREISRQAVAKQYGKRKASSGRK